MGRWRERAPRRGCRNAKGEPRRGLARFRPGFLYDLSDLIEASDGISLGSFLALNDVELDVVAFFEALISVKLNCRVVDEDIGAVFAPDESVAFCVIKPFDLAFISSHVPYPFSANRCRGPPTPL
jgi:hypothetical protein